MTVGQLAIVVLAALTVRAGDAPVAAAPSPAIAEIVSDVSLSEIQRHLGAIEGVRSSPEQLAVTADYIAAQLTAHGWTVTRQPVINGDNIIARRPAASQRDDAFVIGAHYDTVPESPGADDNGVAVAGLLEMARVLADADLAVPIELVAFADEELGLQGSRRLAKVTRDDLREIVGMISLEMIGYTCPTPGCQAVFPRQRGCLEVSNSAANVGTFIAAVANTASAGLLDDFTAAAAAYVPELDVEFAIVAGQGGCRGDTRRSDHASYWDVDYAALMLTDTANFRNPNYHQPSDTAATLDLPFAHRVVKAALATALTRVGFADRDSTPTSTSVPPPTPTPLAADARRRVLIPDTSEIVVLDAGDPTPIAAVPFLPSGTADLVIASHDGRRAFAMTYRREKNPARLARMDLIRNEIAMIEAGAPYAVAIAPDDRTVYLGQRDPDTVATLELRDPDTLCATARIDLGVEATIPSSIAVDAAGRRAFVTDINNDRLLAVDLEAGAVVGAVDLGVSDVVAQATSVVLSGDGTRAFVALRSTGKVAVVDTETLTVRRTFLIQPGANRWAPAPDGRTALLTISGSGDPRAVHLIDFAAERAVRTLDFNDDATPAPFTPVGAAFAPDGAQAYVVGCGSDPRDRRRTLILDAPALTMASALPYGTCGYGIAAVAVPAGEGTPLPTPRGDCPLLPTFTFTATPEPSATASVTATATTTATASVTSSATSSPTRPAGSCAGDCGGDGAVSIDDLVRAVNVALGGDTLTACPDADGDGDGAVTISELIAAVRAALDGCS